MGIPCTLTSSVTISEGDGIDVTVGGGGDYTIALAAATRTQIDQYQVYANEAARDADNPSPTSGQMCFTQDLDILWVHDGTGWVVISEPDRSYTPSVTNITVGQNGTITGRMHRCDGWCDFEAVFTFGSGGVPASAMGTNPTISLPYEAAAHRGNQFYVDIADAAPAFYAGMTDLLVASDTTVGLFAANAASTITVRASITSTSPMTWAAGDVLAVGGRFKMASRYS